MIDISKGLDNFASQVMERRKLLKRSSVLAAATGVASLPFANEARAASITVQDADVLNFALNLEYLEAEYYVRGVTGQPLSAFINNPKVVSTNVAVKSGSTQVSFTNPQLAGYFSRIASDEIAHVGFLLAALGNSAVAEPQIDLVNSFNAAYAAATGRPGATFDPYSSQIAFLVGAYIFEDVGVTAYGGGAAFLATPANISYAASVLAMEGYHAGAIRGFLASNGGSDTTNAISALRAKLSGTGPNTANLTPDDNGTSLSSLPYNIINADSEGQSFRRTFNQVLSVVYSGGTTGGLFFPNGMNGTISSTANLYANQNTTG